MPGRVSERASAHDFRSGYPPPLAATSSYTFTLLISNSRHVVSHLHSTPQDMEPEDSYPTPQNASLAP